MKYSSLLSLIFCTQTLAWAPADDIPKPKPERCKYLSGSGEVSLGLSQSEVSNALNAVIQHALYCEPPENMKEVHLSFELNVGCRGIVEDIEVTDDGGAPEAYVTCVQEVIEKADFPAHDMEDGMTVAYPVDVAW